MTTTTHLFFPKQEEEDIYYEYDYDYDDDYYHYYYDLPSTLSPGICRATRPLV